MNNMGFPRKGKRKAKKETVPFGEKYLEGILSKELETYLKQCRDKVDKTFINAQVNPSESSEGMEKSFEIIMMKKKVKELEPSSFTLGIIFAISRIYFLVSQIKKEQKKNEKKDLVYVS